MVDAAQSKLGFVGRLTRSLSDSRPKWWVRLFAFFLGPALLGAGVFLSLWWVPATGDLVRSQWWEPAEARRVADHGQTDIRYSYQSKGESFSGTRYFFGRVGGKVAEREISDFSASHAIEESFEIWVNPDSPGEAVVERRLAPWSLLAIPGSLVCLFFGFCGVALVFLPTVAYWWRRGLKKRFLAQAPDFISASLKTKSPKMVFCAPEYVKQGLGALVRVVGLGLLAGLALTTAAVMRNGAYVWWLLSLGVFCPLFLAGLASLWKAWRHLRGAQWPGLVFVFQKWQAGQAVGAEDRFGVHWLPDPDEFSDFRSCRFGLARSMRRQSFRRWKKEHPDWQDGLVQIESGTLGAHEFDLAEVGRFDGPPMPGDQLMLVMIWQEWDGAVREGWLTLGEMRA